MSFIDAVRNVLGLADRQPAHYVPGSQRFLELDTDAVRDELRLDARAKLRGTSNQPASESKGLDEVETAVINLIESERKKSKDKYLGQIEAYQARLANLDLEKAGSDIRILADTTITDFKLRATEGLDRMANLQREVSDKEEDLRNFRADNGLKRSPNVRGRGAVVFMVGFVIFVFVLESLVNGALLGKGAEFGLAQGILIAMALSLINIVPAWLFAGPAFSMLQHRSRPVWGTGLAITVIWLVIAIFFNLAVGHYRDALGGPNPEVAGVTTIASIKAHLFQLADIQSYFLWMIGLLVSSTVAFDRYKMDDPYPGYGKIHRAFMKALEEFMDAKLEIQDELNTWRDEAVAKMQKARESTTNWRKEFDRVTSAQENFFHKFSSHMEHLESSANTLLSVYREENKRLRKTSAPKHFDIQWHIPANANPSPPVLLGLNSGEVKILVTDTTNLLESSIKKLNIEYQNQMKKFANISDMFSSEL